MFEQNMNIPNMDFDTNVTGNNNVIDNDMDVDINMMGSGANMYNGNGQNMQQGCGCPMNACNEAIQEKCIHRTFVHEIPHD